MIGVLQLARLGDWVQTLPLLEQLAKSGNEDWIPICDARVSDAVRALTQREPLVLPHPTSSLPAHSEFQLHNRLSNFLLTAPRFTQVIRLNDTPLARYWEQLLGDSPDYRLDEATRRSEAVIRTLPQIPTYYRIHTSDLWRWRIGDEPLRISSAWCGTISRIGIGVGSGGVERRWGADRLQSLIQLVRINAPVDLIGIENEVDLLEGIQLESSDHYPIDNRLGKDSISDLLHRFQQPGYAFVGMDTGTLHLAAHCGAATFGVFENGANPWSTAALGPYATGVWKSDQVSFGEIEYSLSRFLTDPVSFSPIQSIEFVVNRDDQTSISILHSSQVQITNFKSWVSDWIQSKTPAIRLAKREPFLSLERQLIDWTDAAYEPCTALRPLFPETIEEIFLTTLRWSLDQSTHIKKRTTMKIGEFDFERVVQ